MPKIKKNKIEQCTKIFIYRDLKCDSFFEMGPCFRIVWPVFRSVTNFSKLDPVFLIVTHF